MVIGSASLQFYLWHSKSSQYFYDFILSCDWSSYNFYFIVFWPMMTIDTHFRDTFFTSSIQPSPTVLWAQFMYYILFYSFKYSLSPCDILWKIEKVWFGGYESVSFRPFAWAQPMPVTKWAKDTSSTSGSWRRSCTWNFHPKTAFMLWLTMALSEPIFPLKNNWLSLANSSY